MLERPDDERWLHLFGDMQNPKLAMIVSAFAARHCPIPLRQEGQHSPVLLDADQAVAAGPEAAVQLGVDGLEVVLGGVALGQGHGHGGHGALDKVILRRPTTDDRLLKVEDRGSRIDTTVGGDRGSVL